MSLKHKVLVTGGSGYIGSHTVVELQEQGYEVIIVDNLSNSSIEVLDRIESISGTRPTFECFDLSHPDKVDHFFSRHTDIKAIIHFAASKAVGESVELPLLYYQNNLSSMLNLLQAIKKYNIQHFVFSSSCTVYGEPDQLPVTESSPVKPATSPYGNTKQIGEEILRDTAYAYPELQFISLRYFNPIGAHDSALIGELPNGVPLNLVPFITQTAIGIRKKLLVFGNDYNTADGSCVRDYIHVADLAKAHVIAIDRLISGKNKANLETFNLGTGKGISVLEAIQSFEKVSGQKLNYEIVARREGDVEKVYADTSYANDELGWKAKLTIDDAMLSAWHWEKALDKNK